MLKALFSSQTRVKLLKSFLLNPQEEFFIRQLTRLLDEQINSVRRELDNLKKIGLVKSRLRNRHKYFFTNTSFPLYNELRNIFVKAYAEEKNMKKDLEKLGQIDFAMIGGQLVNDKEGDIDLLIVGNVVTKKLEDYFIKDLGKHDIKFSVMNKEDFDYRQK